MNDYQTVFTVFQKSPPWWLSAVVPTTEVAFTALAIVAIVKYKKRRVAVVIAYVVMLFMVMTLSPAGVSDMYARARDSYVKGDYSIAEGAVVNFHPMPYSGHQNETFSVNGVEFSLLRLRYRSLLRQYDFSRWPHTRRPACACRAFR